MIVNTSCSLSVVGDTTSPATEITATDADFDTLHFVVDRFGDGPFAFQLFPRALFSEILRINRLRKRSVSAEPARLETGAEEANEILERIEIFCPNEWSETRSSSSQDDWRLLGHLFQAAVTLYCISSMQSLSILDSTQTLEERRHEMTQKLHQLLEQALSSEKAKRFLLWPLFVLGFEAGEAAQPFVNEHLVDLGACLGSLSPQTAQETLQAFWRSGESRWDACFDRPYVFTSQFAVELSRMAP